MVRLCLHFNHKSILSLDNRADTHPVASVNVVLEILNMEFSPHRFLPPLVAWDLRPLCYGHLADLLTTHWGQEYSQTINCLRCHLSFALLRFAIICIHGSRSSAHRPVLEPLDLSMVLAESRPTN